MSETTPDNRGRFGEFGGRYIAETLMQPVLELEQAYQEQKNDPAFKQEVEALLKDYVGRPTPLTFAANLTRELGGAKIYLKREDLTHTGAHKINNTIGQAVLARRMGKKRLIAETGAGQHGVASATVAALMGMECTVYMGERDTIRQALNVYRMELLGATVVPVTSGSRTLKDAINEAMRDWVTHPESYYLLGSVLGPHPYPEMVRNFQSVIGREAKEQILAEEGKLPDQLIACVGGGSNSIGLFYEFISDESVSLMGVEAGGHGVESGKHAARFAGGSPGVFHGTRSFFLQDDSGQIRETHSISAGLDYAGVGPEHAELRERGRAQYTSIDDNEALNAFRALSRLEGIIPALESSHAVAQAMKMAPSMKSDQVILVNLSGRGDKDVDAIRQREQQS